MALQIDGDGPRAQQLAERFHVRSYPTLIVFNPAGAEITRLPCELDGARFLEIFALALSARRTVAGPATRLQWGATYLQGLVDFAPHDAGRVEPAAALLRAARSAPAP